MLFVLLALAAAPGPTLSYDGRVAVKMGPSSPLPLENATTASDEWIYLVGAVAYSCPSSPLQSIELSGGDEMKTQLAAPMKRSRRSGEILGSIPLWRTEDAKAACKKGEKTLRSSISATVTCEGEQPVVVPFSVPLELNCSRKQPFPPANFQNPWSRIGSTLKLGKPGNLKLEVPWSKVRPTPVSATVVELDAAGEVANRFMSLQPRGDATTDSVEVTLDTSAERRTVLGLELKFDGHTAIKPLRVVDVRNEERELESVLERSMAVINRLFAAIPNPCAKREEALAWLRKQPEVSSAEFKDQLTVTVTYGFPVPVQCHH